MKCAGRWLGGKKESRGTGDEESQALIAEDSFTQIPVKDLDIGQLIGTGTYGKVFKGSWNGTAVGTLPQCYL